jgi:hypothetical protein
MSMISIHNRRGVLVLLSLLLFRVCASHGDAPATQPTAATKPSKLVELAVYLPAARLDRSTLGTPFVVEYKASDQLPTTRQVCLSNRSKELYDRFVDGLTKPPVGDQRIPDRGDGLWLTYRTVEKLPTRPYTLEYTSPFEFVTIEPGKTGFAKIGVVSPELNAGKVEFQAHLILDKKVVAESPPVIVPVDDK